MDKTYLEIYSEMKAEIDEVNQSKLKYLNWNKEMYLFRNENSHWFFLLQNKFEYKIDETNAITGNLLLLFKEDGGVYLKLIPEHLEILSSVVNELNLVRRYHDMILDYANITKKLFSWIFSGGKLCKTDLRLSKISKPRPREYDIRIETSHNEVLTGTFFTSPQCPRLVLGAENGQGYVDIYNTLRQQFPKLLDDLEKIVGEPPEEKIKLDQEYWISTYFSQIRHLSTPSEDDLSTVKSIQDLCEKILSIKRT